MARIRVSGCVNTMNVANFYVNLQYLYKYTDKTKFCYIYFNIFIFCFLRVLLYYLLDSNKIHLLGYINTLLLYIRSENISGYNN